MIHFAIGTKAQFIKMAPVMRVLQDRNESYHLLNLSQHGSITGQILADFDLRPVVTRFDTPNESVVTYRQAMRWIGHGLWDISVRGATVKQRLFRGQNGVVLLHGDTASTLLGLYLARRAGLPTALVEAGLSSGRLLNPFPEEWIRRHVSRRAEILFAPDAAAESWLRSGNFRGLIVNTGHNTGRDALFLMLRCHATTSPAPTTPYGVIALHRLETLSRPARLRKAIQHIADLAERLGALRFYLHPPTAVALRRQGLLNGVTNNANIEVRDLEPYPQFVQTLVGACCIITDGGSIQEEASYLGKPCLILRERTERPHGLGRNARLATWDPDTDAAHLRGDTHRQPPATPADDQRASRLVVDTLYAYRNPQG